MARLDIHKKAFISWTGKDAYLKDKVVKFLENSKIDVTVSNKECIDNFIEWSKESAMACRVMILLATENVIDSGVVYMEVGELIKSGSAKRLIVLSQDLETWKQVRESIISKLEKDSNYNSNIDDIKNALEYKSIIQYNNIDNFDDALPELSYKIVRYMIKDSLDAYKAKVLAEEMTVIPYVKTIGFANINFLSVPRILIEEDSKQNDVKEYSSDDDFWSLAQTKKPIFIHGAGGEGKSEFIRQFKQSLVRKSIKNSNTEEDILPINIDCISVANETDDAIKRKIHSKFVGSIGLEEWKYEEFCNIFSNKYNVGDKSNRVKIVLLLDGLDEVPADKLESLKKRIDEFLNSVDNVTLFVLGRNKDTADNSLGLDTVNMHLKKLQDGDGENSIHAICESIFVGFEESEKGDKNKFYLSLADLNQEIKSNPFLVTQLALIYRVDRSVPDTVFGIFDKLDQLINEKEIQNLENNEKLKSIIKNPSKLMRNYAYQLFLSPDKDSTKIMSTVLINLDLAKGWDREELAYNAKKILDYFEERKIITIDGKLYHKMFLEYYTAVYLYNEIFDLSGQLKSESMLEEGKLWKLVNNWQDKYWYNTIQMFIVKADSRIDAKQMQELCRFIVNQGFEFKQEEIGPGVACFDYTLLCEVASVLKNHRDIVNILVATDLLTRSANRQLPPYGPLCWYASRWELYSYLVRALYTNLSTDERALSLTADVCRIFGQAYTVQAVMGEEGKAIADTLWNNCQDKLEGVRKALCGAFCGVQVDCPQGDNIYPRFFNTKEVARLADYGVGVEDRMAEPFQDQLGLYNLDDLNVVNNDECMGLVSWLNNGRQEIEDILVKYSTHRICGVCANNGSADNFGYVEFDRTNVSVLYVPENVEEPDEYYDNFMPLSMVLFKGIYITSRVKVTKQQTKNAFFRECSFIKEVCFDDDVMSIRGYAFYDCYSLTSVTISDKVRSIEDYAFYNCSSLTRITIPDNVKKIGEGAFACCGSLTSIKIPNSVINIGKSAFFKNGLVKVNINCKIIEEGTFSWCSYLKRITIGDNTEIIQKEAFSYCNSLEHIYIGKRVKTIKPQVFYESFNIKEIEVSKENKYFIIKNNCLIEEKNKKLITGYSHFIIPNDGSIEIIDRFAFAYRKNITKIDIPKSVLIIDRYAFFNCENLKKISFNNSLKIIGPWAFDGCYKLKEIKLPESVKEIGSEAFSGCNNIKEIIIPNNVKKIGYYAFNCINIRKIIIPSRFALDVPNIFNFSERFPKIEFIGELDLNFEEDVIYSKDNKKLLCVPIFYEGELCIKEGIIEICDAAVQYGNISKIKIPYGVEKIGNGAFYGCTNLKEIILPDTITTIDDYAFNDCTSLEQIIIPSKVVKIGRSAFEGCRELKSIELSNKIETIESDSFKGCIHLENINIPTSVKEIKDGAFDGCFSLKQIIIPEGVKTLGDNVFSKCYSLDKITLPKTLEEIGFAAFDNCYNLISIIIPDKVEEIKVMFRDCSSLKEIYIGKGVNKINTYAFNNCNNLEIIKIDRLNNYYQSMNNCIIEKNTKTMILGCKSSIIPNDESVETIDKSAFEYCGKPIKINIPKSVKKVYRFNFENNFLEQKIEIDPENKNYFIHNKCIIEKDSKTLIIGSNDKIINIDEIVETIGHLAFYNCNKVESLYFPDNLISIESEAFSGCKGLLDIKIPMNVMNLGKQIFENCNNIQTISIPYIENDDGMYVNREQNYLAKLFGGIEKIPQSLKKVIIISGIKINDIAFAGCKYIEEITIPKSVMKIGENAFSGCTGLKKIKIPKNFEPQIKEIFADAPDAEIELY